jgi:NAD-dependent dihydropyrimidine dehydrogenase PreA subunit
LTEQDLQKLYLTVVVGDDDKSLPLEYRTKEIAAVWRDIRNHGILSPPEFEHKIQLAEIMEHQNENLYDRELGIMDECEIVEEYAGGEISLTTDRQGKSSHERVELVPMPRDAKTKETPVWLRDGDFVFIDEESCIGCMQVSF